jgi:hypothetical protein
MSLIRKSVKRNTRTNDGSTVPIGEKSPMNAGKLDINTPFSNNEVFDRKPGARGTINGDIEGMESRKSESLDKPGFDASGDCFYKFGIPYGEKAYFNQLPPGPDISDQAYLLENDMPLRLYMGGLTYPGDTPWAVRDVEE